MAAPPRVSEALARGSGTGRALPPLPPLPLCWHLAHPPAPPRPNAQASLSPEEASELEEVQRWVETMAQLEGEEQDHLVALALKHAGRARLREVARRAKAGGAAAPRAAVSAR